MSDYQEPQAKQPVTETPAPSPVVEKKKREGKKLTDKQKTELNKHMEKMKKGGMSLTEQRSHRMRMMGQLKKDEKMSVTRAHKNLMK
jgi:transcription initiation factor IIF auxiliary subunit